MRREVEERRRVARDEDPVGMVRAGPSPVAPWPTESSGRRRSRTWEMAGRARDVAIATEDLVERERLTEPRERGTHRRRVERHDPASCRKLTDDLGERAAGNIIADARRGRGDTVRLRLGAVVVACREREGDDESGEEGSANTERLR